KGDRVLLDDGRIELAVREKADGRATCAVVRGGLLGERKGVLVPGRTPPLPALTDKDLADLKLAVELGVDYVALSFVRKPQEVIDHANRAGVPVITATEMLESMVTSNRPTRAEASDVANAIWDGTDAVMLSQETSVGAHPVEAVRAMARICMSAQRHPAFQRQ